MVIQRIDGGWMNEQIFFCYQKILVEKDGERQIDEKKIEDYKWNFDTNKSLQEIYVSMLNEYFFTFI